MNPQKEWQIFLRRIQAEFAIQKYSIYAGDGVKMKHRHGTELQELMLERYLSYETTVILTDQQETVLVTRFRADGVLYLVALYTSENGLTENETEYIMNDLHQLCKKLNGGKE